MRESHNERQPKYAFRSLGATALQLVSKLPQRTVALFVLLPMIPGCGSDPVGPARYAVEGQVTLDGLPVERAEISFIPDSAAGNSGPAAYAFAEQGRFSLPAKIGPVAGRTNVRVVAFDGNAPSMPLGDFEIPVVVEPIDVNTIDLTISKGKFTKPTRSRSEDSPDGDVESEEEQSDS